MRVTPHQSLVWFANHLWFVVIRAQKLKSFNPNFDSTVNDDDLCLILNADMVEGKISPSKMT
jgi:hypothetical protein